MARDFGASVESLVGDGDLADRIEVERHAGTDIGDRRRVVVEEVDTERKRISLRAERR